MIDTDERRTKVVSTVRGLQQRDKTMVLLRSARSIVLGHNADNNEIVYSIISMLSTDQCKAVYGAYLGTSLRSSSAHQALPPSQAEDHQAI